MNRPEEAFQRSVVQYLRVLAPDLVFFAVSNGGYRTKAEAGIMKAMGQAPGVPDLIFCLPGGRFAGMELKSPKGRLSPAQAVFAEAICKSDGNWAEARTLEEVERHLRRWGVKLRAHVA